MSRRLPKVFVSPKRDECAVSCAVRELRVAFVAAVGLAESLEALEQQLVEAARHPLLAHHGPTTCQRGQMNEVKRLPVAVRAEECLDLVARHFGIHRLHAGERKDGIVKVWPSIAVESRALRRKLLSKEFSDKIGRIA